MRDCLSVSQFLFTSLLCAVLSPAFACAQLPDATNTCPPVPIESRPVVRTPEGPATQVRVREVTFEGATKLDLAEQNRIASTLTDAKEDTPFRSLDEVQTKVAAAWQHHGFFKVKVRAESRELSGNEDTNTKEIAVTFHVNEGDQYGLGQIHFLNGTQFTSAQLRPLFPIAEGEIFDTQKISEGLEALRKAYGEMGFINFTAVPESIVDEQNLRISLDMDLDEGKQFHISEVEILGPDQEQTQRLLHQYKLEPGATFNSGQLGEFAKAENLHVEDDIERRINEKNGTVCLIVDARHSR